MARPEVHVHRFRCTEGAVALMPTVQEIINAAATRRNGHLLPAIRVEIDSCAVRFETDCLAALESLDTLLRQTFHGRYFDYRVAPVVADERLPSLRFLDRAEFHTTYDAETDVCVFCAPWVAISGSSLLAMWLHLLSELVRQRRGEYLLHASAVVRDDNAIVLFGQGESGKTIGALDLCLRHGFRLFANNRVKVGFGNGGLRLIKGDAVLRLRYSSLREYNEPLAQRIFEGTAADMPAWDRKQTIDPQVLGIKVADATPRVAAFILLTLDRGSDAGVVTELSSDATSHDAFVAMSDVSQEISRLIRGSSFIPLVNGSGFRDIYVPCFDSPHLVRQRVAFLETLFTTSRVVKVRAPLERAISSIVRYFEGRPPISSRDLP